MGWSARIKAALHGEVEGGDVAALLAASRPLASLRQDLDGRRLDLELAHAGSAAAPGAAGKEWRIADELGEVAAALWLAENLVSLAQSLYDAEGEAHPAAPSTMSGVAHGQALALLQPVGPVIAEISAALVDPSRRLALPLPVSVAPRGEVAGGPPSLPGPVPPSYLRGLLRGAERLEGVTQVTLEEYATLAGRSGAPPWMGAAVQRLRGEMAAARTRLEMIRARGAPLLNHQALDDTTMRQLAADLWVVVDTYLRIGQMVSAPRLLPGAPPARPRPPTAPDRAAPPRPWPGPGAPSPPAAPPPGAVPAAHGAQPPPRMPAPSPLPPLATPAAPRDVARPLPSIEAGWGRGAPRPGAAGTGERPPSGPEERAMPRIDVSARAPQTPQALPAAPRSEERELPQIAAPSARRGEEHAAPAIARPASASQAEARALPAIAPPAAAQPPTAGTRPAPTAGVTAPTPASPSAGGRRIGRADRWMLSSPAARHRLRASGQEEQAEQELAAFWEGRDWTLSAREHAYLDDVAALVARGAVGASGRSLGACPYAPIYRVAESEVQVDGHRLPAGSRFAFDYRAGHQTLQSGLNAGDGVGDDG